MINNVVLIGRLVRDVDLKFTNSGKAATNFTLAVNRDFKNEQGENEADFISCAAFGKQAENMARFLGKGSLIGVEGRISTRSYQAKDGKTVYITEVITNKVTFIESKKQQGNTYQFGQVHSVGYKRQANNGIEDFEENFDIDMGFNPFTED